MFLLWDELTVLETAVVFSGEEVCGYVDQMNARLSVITKCEVSIHLPSSPSIKLRSDEHETTKNVINKVIHLGSSLVREETY